MDSLNKKGHILSYKRTDLKKYSSLIHMDDRGILYKRFIKSLWDDFNTQEDIHVEYQDLKIPTPFKP